jgi:transcriptional regulator with XRE-family HTH domain
MIGDKIRYLRELNDYTQATLADKLGISRSSVNAWEIGISSISIKNVEQLAILFKVSSDFLLDLDATATVNVSGLTDEQVAMVLQFVEHIRILNKQ